MIRLAVVLTLLPGMALAEMQVRNTRYSCDRGVEVPAVYVNDPDQSIAVLQIEGRQILLYAEPAASGVRYGWPSDGSNFVWWTKGTEAMLYWRDGAVGTETPILTACLQR